VPRFAIAPLGLTTEGSTKFKPKGWKCYLKKLQCWFTSPNQVGETRSYLKFLENAVLDFIEPCLVRLLRSYPKHESFHDRFVQFKTWRRLKAQSKSLEKSSDFGQKKCESPVHPTQWFFRRRQLFWQIVQRATKVMTLASMGIHESRSRWLLWPTVQLRS